MTQNAPEAALMLRSYFEAIVHGDSHVDAARAALDAMTQDAPLDQKALEAAYKVYQRIGFVPNIEHVEASIRAYLAALSRRVPAGGGELKGIAWSDLDYLMSIIDSAIEDGFDPDEDGPLLDQIRAELKAPIPEGKAEPGEAAVIVTESMVEAFMAEFQRQGIAMDDFSPPIYPARLIEAALSALGAKP